MKNTKEEWKDIPNYEGIYQVSNKGQVKSLWFGKDRILKQNDNGNGYLQVTLHKDKKRKNMQVHQLVAMAFLNHVIDGHKIVVDHYPNKTRTNNNLNNLRLVTNRDNLSRRAGSSEYVGVSWSKSSNKWQAQIQFNRKQKNLGTFTKEIDAHYAYQEALENLKKK